ncbi:hypothetical protein Taro_015444, partial [Colocasia esculenta]|nr:hypothetical protein [Colocasia esculenta]
EIGVSVLEEDIVRSDSKREELWLAVVGGVLKLEMTSRGVRSRVSSRPQHPRVPLYFLHHHLWTMVMQTQAQTQAALLAQLQAQALAPVPQEHGHGCPSIMERFKRMAPPTFKGESKPLLTESWMREVEKIFRAIRCAEEDKVSLATYILQVSKMDQYLEEKKAAQKRSTPSYQRKDRKKVVYQSPQRPVAATSQQTVSPQSLGFRPRDKKACPHCGRAQGGSECWKLEGCLAWSASPSSGSSSRASDRETRKASSSSS